MRSKFVAPVLLSLPQTDNNAPQDPSASLSPEELAALDTRLSTLRTETANLTAHAKSLRSTLSTLNLTLSTNDLRAAVDGLDSERAEILGRLKKLRSGDVKPVTREERLQVERDEKKWEGIERRRAKIVKEMWGAIRESLPEGTDGGELRVSLSTAFDLALAEIG
jgi:26S proteasome regulatory subunit, ATPase 3, interacting protein